MRLGKNLHPIGRAIRAGLGAILIPLAFIGPASPWFLLGLVPLITAMTGWCPPYALLGFSTLKPHPCQLKKESPAHTAKKIY